MTTFFSRFPDALTPEVRPIPMPEIYSIHPTDNDLVMTVRWTVGPKGWDQHPPLFAEKSGNDGIALALEMVPPGAVWIPDCPRTFALGAYMLVPGAEE